jgi:hypothetical protein
MIFCQSWLILMGCSIALYQRADEGVRFQPCLPNEAVVSAEPDVAFTVQQYWTFDVRVHFLP